LGSVVIQLYSGECTPSVNRAKGLKKLEEESSCEIQFQMQIKTLSFYHQLLCEHRLMERLNQRKKLIKNNLFWEINIKINCWTFRKHFADLRKDKT